MDALPAALQSRPEADRDGPRQAHLRAAKARTFDELWKAIGNICALFSPDECRNHLKQAGYASDQVSDALVQKAMVEPRLDREERLWSFSSPSLKRRALVGTRLSPTPQVRSVTRVSGPYSRILERAKGFEPSTPTLARLCSTPELHPLARRWPQAAPIWPNSAANATGK